MANLTVESKWSFINYFKEEGNRYFKQKEYHQGLEYYHNCLLFLDAILYFDGCEDEKQRNEICSITSIILSNIAQTHLRAHSVNPDLYNHLLSALNCAQISIDLNPENIKSKRRRIICLYRLGLHEYADEIIEKTSEKITYYTKEREDVKNQSVKHHIDRFKNVLIENNDEFFDNVDCTTDVFLRIAASELIRKGKYELDDFMQIFFDLELEALQVVGMLAIFMNWNHNKIAKIFIKYFKDLKSTKSFEQRKKIIFKTLKMDDILWPTDQAWRELLKLIICDRKEMEYCDIFNCRDVKQLNEVYDKYKHKLVKLNGVKFKKSEEKDDKMNEKLIAIEARIAKVERDNQSLQYKMNQLQIAFAVFVAIVAVFIFTLKT